MTILPVSWASLPISLASLPISLAGEILYPDPSGGVYWPRMSVLAVADLHFEKGSAFARRGILLPPYDSRATLARLTALCARYRPAQVVALGDSFHDGEGPARLPEAEARGLRALTGRHAFTWIAGNHDGLMAGRFGGEIAEELRLGPLVFRHVPQQGAAAIGEIAGHLHPCATVALKAGRLRRRCFAGDGQRLVLPAFGAFTGGLDLFHDAFGGLFGPRGMAWLIGREAVHAFPFARLVPGAV